MHLGAAMSSGVSAPALPEKGSDHKETFIISVNNSLSAWIGRE